MNKLKVVCNGNDGSIISCVDPLENPLGIENWPQSNQDEHRRVNNESENRFPEELLCQAAGFNGRPLTDFVFNAVRISNLSEIALHVALNYEPAKVSRSLLTGIYGGCLDDDRLDTSSKIYEYYKMLYPQYFRGPAVGALRPRRVKSNIFGRHL